MGFIKDIINALTAPYFLITAAAFGDSRFGPLPSLVGLLLAAEGAGRPLRPSKIEVVRRVARLA